MPVRGQAARMNHSRPAGRAMPRRRSNPNIKTEIAHMENDNDILDSSQLQLPARNSMSMPRASKGPSEIAMTDGVAQTIIIKWIEKELEEEKACMSIPFIIILLFVFVAMVSSHLAQGEVRGVEQSISNYLSTSPAFGFANGDSVVGHKTLDDISTVADIYSWCTQGLMKAIHLETFPVSETVQSSIAAGTKIQERNFPTPSPQQGDFLQYNTIIGGIRFQQRRADKTSCRLPDNFNPTSPCYGSEMFLMPPQNYNWWPLAAEEAESQEFFLLSQTLSTWLEKMRDLEVGCKMREVTGGTCLCETCGDYPWIDPSTLKVEVTFVTLNRELGLWSLVNVNFFLNRGGHIWEHVNVESQWVDPYARGWDLALEEGIWFILNMWVLLQEIWEIICATRADPGCSNFLKHITHYFKDAWNLVDLTTITISFVILAVWNSHVSSLASLREEFPSDMSKYDSPTELDSFFTAIQDIFLLELYIRFLFSVYAFVIMLRLFKGYAAQPRLALVTRTLERAGMDLAHFLFVFITIFFAFGAAGLALFGREMDEFSTFALSVNTLYRILLGDFMWDKMAIVGTLPAALFFWFYTVIVVLIMLNMLLAVILDTYSTVKKQVGNAETLWSQSVESFVRWLEKRRNQRVGLDFVWECLVKAVPEDGPLGKSANGEPGRRMTMAAKRESIGTDPKYSRTLLRLDDLLSTVPGLKEREASEILQKSLEDHYFMLQHTQMDTLQEMESLEDVVEHLGEHQNLLYTKTLRAVKEVEKKVLDLCEEVRILKSSGGASADDVPSEGKPGGADPPSDPGGPQGGPGATRLPAVFSPALRGASSTDAPNGMEGRMARLEGSFSNIMARLDTVDRIPLRVRDLLTPIQIHEEASGQTGCVSQMLSGCRKSGEKAAAPTVLHIPNESPESEVVRSRPE